MLKEGKDVLYLAFSSGLSGTYNSCRVAAEELRDSYPDRKLEVDPNTLPRPWDEADSCGMLLR